MAFHAPTLVILGVLQASNPIFTVCAEIDGGERADNCDIDGVWSCPTSGPAASPPASYAHPTGPRRCTDVQACHKFKQSPAFPVPKTSKGKWRLVVDHRKLNEQLDGRPATAKFMF